MDSVAGRTAMTDPCCNVSLRPGPPLHACADGDDAPSTLVSARHRLRHRPAPSQGRRTLPICPADRDRCGGRHDPSRSRLRARGRARPVRAGVCRAAAFPGCLIRSRGDLDVVSPLGGPAEGSARSPPCAVAGRRIRAGRPVRDGAGRRSSWQEAGGDTSTARLRWTEMLRDAGFDVERFVRVPKVPGCVQVTLAR